MKYVSGWNKSLFEEVSSKKDSKSSAAIKRKLERIKRKLRAGGRLTAEEKAFLRRYAPSLYQEAMAAERERAAYEERLKKCRTKEEAERMKMEKMMELAAAKEEDVETKMMRMAQTKAAEEDAASAVNQKPSQTEESRKRTREQQEKQEDKKVRDRKRADKERHDRERTDRERWKDRYHESERLKEEQEQRYVEKEAGIIYGRPNYSAQGQVHPLPGGVYQEMTSGNGQEDGTAESGTDNGYEAERAAGGEEGPQAFAKGYAAYQAAMQESL